jgi:hypothetical protein
MTHSFDSFRFPRFLVNPKTNSSTSFCNFPSSRDNSESGNGFSGAEERRGESFCGERIGISVDRLIGEFCSVEVIGVFFECRGGGGGGGGIEILLDEVSGSRGIVSGGEMSDVTEVSESFRRGRGGGGFEPVELLGSVGTGGRGKSFLNEDVRSRCLVDAEEGDRLGAGGAGGKLLLIVLLSSDFLSSGIILF